MSPSITVRPARTEDKSPILAFCEDTFSWGDYIAQVYDAWLANPNGRLVVGLVDDRPAALVHVAFLEKAVAWMEGMRVHPDYRRLGLATAIDIAGRNYARQHGQRVARLATSIKNIPAQRTLEPLGYHLLARTDSWVAPPSDVGDARLPVASEDDISLILDIWHQSPLRNASAALVQDPDWRWTEFTPDRVKQHIAQNQIRILPNGFSILLYVADSGGSLECHVEALIGDPSTIHVLALGARAEAKERGCTGLEAMVQHDDHLAGILSNTGYVREGAMLVYECAL